MGFQIAKLLLAPDFTAPAISDGKPSPVTYTLPILPWSFTACAAATMPTEDGETITFKSG
ncbi:hypothetical protein D3C78_1764200 [compost metagenome]